MRRGGQGRRGIEDLRGATHLAFCPRRLLPGLRAVTLSFAYAGLLSLVHWASSSERGAVDRSRRVSQELEGTWCTCASVTALPRKEGSWRHVVEGLSLSSSATWTPTKHLRQHFLAQTPSLRSRRCLVLGIQTLAHLWSHIRTA